MNTQEIKEIILKKIDAIFNSHTTDKKMKFDWENWNFGGKVIFVTACIAMMSMFMDWVDVGIMSQTGLTQGAFVFLGLWVYPVLILFKNKPISRIWGLACAIASIVFSIIYINSKSGEFFGREINASSTGAWLFLLTSMVLIIGVIKYRPTESTD